MELVKQQLKKLLEQNYRVYGAARTEKDLKYLENYENGNYILMDITKAEMRKNCIEKILAKEKTIDILINNAGYGAYGAIEEVPIAEVKKQFAVNLFGLSELTKLVIPKMRENNSAKIINISSIAGKTWTPLGGWYHASKFALEGLSDCLRNELKEFGIDVILIQPGAIETSWADKAGENLIASSGNGIYKKQAARKAAKYKEMYGQSSLIAKPEVVAAKISKVLTISKPKARYAVPFHAKLILFLRWLLPDRIYDYFTNKFF